MDFEHKIHPIQYLIQMLVLYIKILIKLNTLHRIC